MSARSAKSCIPSGLVASAVTVHLRRKNPTRRTNQGIAIARIGGEATAMASSTASHSAVVLRLCPAPAISRAAPAAATIGLPTASPTSGICLALAPAAVRFPARSCDPASSCRPAPPIAAIAVCTPNPINTHIEVQAMTLTSLNSWASRRSGLVE